MCGMNARGAHHYAGIFMLSYIPLKMAVLLHKTTLVNFPMATTVYVIECLEIMKNADAK